MKKLLLVFVVLGLVACNEKDVAFASDELKQKCAELDAQSEEKYELLTGVAEIVGTGTTIPVECLPFDEGCKDVVPKAPVYAVMHSIKILRGNDFVAYNPNKNSSNQKIKNKLQVYTPLEPTKDLLNKELYFQKNEKYVFCAKMGEEQVIQTTDNVTYHIKDVSMIKKLD